MRSIRKYPLLAAALVVAFLQPRSAITSDLEGPATPASPSAAGTDLDPEVLRLREAAWRAWFAGDEAALREMLPPEFIGIDMGDGPFSDLARTLAEARTFHAEGGRLVDLEFPETRAQQFGDVVVLYGRFSLELESGAKKSRLAGRLTEVFVRRAGRWWHPGWHLDLAPTPPRD